MFIWILGIISFALSIWAIVNILNSNETAGTKTLWIIGVLVFPTIGFLVWYFAGPKSALKL